MNNQDRAKAVWDRLLGLFGDALLRKFDAEPPDEWVAAISVLNDFQLERGLKRMVFTWKGGPPNLPDFMRICRAIGDDDFDTPKQRIALPSHSDFTGDHWDIAGNMRLLKHITTLLSANSKALGKVLPTREIRDSAGKFLHLESCASAEQISTTELLVAYKKAWSQDMREYVDSETGEIGRPPFAEQERTWSDTIARAMSDIQRKEAA